MKNKAIVIGTYFGREDWLKDCVNSLKNYTHYPVISVCVPWELNVIKWIYDNTTLDEFIFLQDTVVVKDTNWIRVAFQHDGPVSLCEKPFFMYLGKYRRCDLETMTWPDVRNKREAVTMEGKWTSLYNLSPNVRYFWNLDDTEVYEERHGRLNKVIENEHIIKYKGTWSPEMIPE